MRRRAACLCAMVIALGLIVPRVAYANVAWQDQTDRMTAVVAGYPYTETGRCSALMEYLGFDWSTIGSKQRQTLLTDRNSDNPFTQSLAQVYNVQYETNGTLNWPIISVWSTLFGLSEQWDISLTFSQYQDTQEYVRSILTGKPTGGGGGGPEVADGYVLIPVQPWAPDPPTTLQGIGYVAIREETLENVEQYATQHGQDVLARVAISSGKTWCSVMTAPSDAVRLNGSDYHRPYGCTWTSTFDSYYVEQRDIDVLEIDGKRCAVLQAQGGVRNFPKTDDGTWYVYYYAFGSDVVTPTPTPVPTPTPDPPVTPPTPPTGPTFIFDPTIAPSAGDPDFTEITDWLRLIYNEEVDIEATFTEVMNNLGTDLADWFQKLNDSITSTAEWAVDEIEFYLDGFSVDLFRWLKQIVSKMGGNGTPKPDPTTDEKGFWEWLLEQFAKFFEGADLGGKVGGLRQMLAELTEFFPFSLPWDLMAIFGLFMADPVTPVFDLYMPVPAVVSSNLHVNLHVDLHQWDGIMTIVRGLEFIFFAAWLLSKVPDWLNDIKVGDF